MPPQSLRAVAGAVTLLCTLAAASAHAQGTLSEVMIQGSREDLQGAATSASEGVVTSRQLQARPLQRAGDVMEAVPGLIATQHAGEGKANQYFLRGFNLDHGTDFATYVDGVPINLPTHGHGQGYTDLNFLIPELVDSVAYRKGPYYAEEGDFAAVGSARIRTVRKLPQTIVLLEGGSFKYRRVLAAASPSVASGDLLLAAERLTDDGPWSVAQRLRKTNLLGRYTRGSESNGFSFGLTHYEASWTSTDQVAQRAIDSGLIGRFDSLDPTAGGRTRRTGIDGTWTHTADRIQTRISAYALRYTFDLFSQFTYATRGCDAAPLAPDCDSRTDLDQFEQVDGRHVLGLGASQQRSVTLAGRETTFSYGVDLRTDRIGEVALYDSFQRARTAQVRSDSARVDAFGAWTQAEVQVAPQWRVTGGVRWDHRSLAVSSSVAANSGNTSASIASPKLSVAYSPSDRIDWYANAGRGFHSNDARGTVVRVDPRDGVTPVAAATPLVRATGYELGTRQKWGDSVVTTAALWALRLDSELLFVGDAGTTEASRPSLRKGLEFTAHWRPLPAWEIEGDLALTRPRFDDQDPSGDRIPGAMERVASLGLTWIEGPWTVGARLRHFGSQALVEDNSLRGHGSTTTNVRVAYRIARQAELALDVFNLFDRKVADVQYAYASRLPGEAPFADGVTPATLHVHPATPRSLRVGLKLFF